MGDYGAATPIYSKIYSERQKLFGPKHIATIIAQCNHGNHSRELRKFDLATNLLTNCVQIATEKLGENHTITLVAETCLALLQKNMGNLKEAEKLLREVHTKGQKCTGPWARDWDNSSRATNLALVLQLEGKIKEACEILQNCYSESEKILGQRHEFVLIDMHNLGAALFRAGEYVAAERILGQCYLVRIELLTNGHIRTFMTLWWWAITLVRLGNLEKARDQLWEVMRYLEEFYRSSKHRRVCICRELYEAITPIEQRKKEEDDGDFYRQQSTRRSFRPKV